MLLFQINSNCITFFKFCLCNIILSTRMFKQSWFRLQFHRDIKMHFTMLIFKKNLQMSQHFMELNLFIIIITDISKLITVHFTVLRVFILNTIKLWVKHFCYCYYYYYSKTTASIMVIVHFLIFIHYIFLESIFIFRY